MKLGTENMNRIPGQLKQAVSRYHVATLESISERMYEEWIGVGLQTAEIATSLAFLYERLANYVSAIACAAEAVAVCRKQLVRMIGSTVLVSRSFPSLTC